MTESEGTSRTPRNVVTMPTPTLAVFLPAESAQRALLHDARRAFSQRPNELPPKWFYDERGSKLFDEITRLDEYYPTRRERWILDRYANDIAALTRADTLVELGSGTSDKTRLLIDALRRAGTLRRFVPFDVSVEVLSEAANTLADRYPDIEVEAVVGDFELHLGHLPSGNRRLIAFLGGTIGNLYPEERASFLGALRDLCGPDDAILVGTDRVKDPARLVAAYDDASGVTAAFNLNVLRVVNRELNANFDEERFQHVARYHEHGTFIEMALRSTIDQTVRIEALDMDVPFEAGDEIRTEISTKFTLTRFGDELNAAGFSRTTPFCDLSNDFALWLARP